MSDEYRGGRPDEYKESRVEKREGEKPRLLRQTGPSTYETLRVFDTDEEARNYADQHQVPLTGVWDTSSEH